VAAGALSAMAHEALVENMRDYLYSQGFDESTEENKREFDALMNLGSTLLGAAVGALADGTQGATTGATTALNADVYNRMLHEDEKARIKELAGGDVDKEIRLTAAACALTACYAEYPEDSALYDYYWNLAITGTGFTEEYQLLKAQPGLFEYTGWNLFFDWNRYINNNYQIVDRTIGGAQMVGGVLEVGFAVGTSPVACGATLTAGCVATVVVTVNGIDNAYAGSKRLIYGVPQDTFLNQSLQALGLSPEAASRAEVILGLGSAAVMSNTLIKSIPRGSATSQAPKGGMPFFTTTKPVAVSGSKATEVSKSYEAGVQGLYNTSPQKYTATVNGQTVNGIADGVTSFVGRPTAIEAKYVGSWSESIRNPASPIGSKPWAVAEQQAMVNQAAKYSSGFEGGVIYHTNSVELATHYSQVFKNAGITNFKFVITPVK
jgi:hypothetical protein